MAGESLTVFRSRVLPGALEEYGPLAEQMAALAETMPGFVERTAYTADDGERLTLVVFDSREHQQAWRDHPEHQEAQRIGIDRFYSEYRIQVCTLEDDRRFSKS